MVCDNINTYICIYKFLDISLLHTNKGYKQQLKITIMITDEKIIEAQIDRAAETEGDCFGMSYEQGVRDALEWVMYGEENEPPIE